MNKFEEYLEAVREAVLLQEGNLEYEYSEARGIDIEAIYKAPNGYRDTIFRADDEKEMNDALKKFKIVTDEKELNQIVTNIGGRGQKTLKQSIISGKKQGISFKGNDYIFGAYLAEPFEKKGLPFGNTSAPKGQVQDGGDYYGTKTSSGDMKEENNFIYFKNNKGDFKKVFYGGRPMKSTSQEGKDFMKYFNSGKIIRRSTQPNILGVKGEVTAYGVGK